MQTEDKRACAACGAANRVDASSCWQCFGRLNAGLPQAPVGFGAHQQQRLRPGFPPPMP